MLKNELNQDILEDSKKFLKKSLKEKDEYLGNALKEKDEYLKSAMQETDEYVKNALKDKDEVIEAMQNSFALRLCSKLVKLLGRKHKK